MFARINLAEATTDAWYELPLGWLFVWLAGIVAIVVLAFTVLVMIPGNDCAPASSTVLTVLAFCDRL